MSYSGPGEPTSNCEPTGLNKPELLTNATGFNEHLRYVQRFLLEMYQTMVDPVEEFKGNIEELCVLLLKRAREDREVIAAQPTHNKTRALEALRKRERAFLEDVLNHLNLECGTPADEEIWAAKTLLESRLKDISAPALAEREPAPAVEGLTADIFLQHETSYTQHREFWVWECSCGAIEEEKFISRDECHYQTRKHWIEAIATSLATLQINWKGRFDELAAEFAILSRACGNWRTWPSEAESDHDHPDWKVATKAILERNELLAAAPATPPATPRNSGQCYSLSACLCCYGTDAAHAKATKHCMYCERPAPTFEEPRAVDNTISIVIRGQEQVSCVMKALRDAGFVAAQSAANAPSGEHFTPKTVSLLKLYATRLAELIGLLEQESLVVGPNTVVQDK